MNHSPKPLITADDVRKVAHLARLKVDAETVNKYVDNLTHILEMIAQINEQDTQNIKPMYSSLDMTLTLREDIATTTNQRELLQKLTPYTESGFYLVPQVIE